MIEVIALKELCRKVGIEKVDAGPKGVVFTFHPSSFPDPQKLMAYVSQQMGIVKLRPDQKMILTRALTSVEGRFNVIKRLLDELSQSI